MPVIPRELRDDLMGRFMARADALPPASITRPVGKSLIAPLSVDGKLDWAGDYTWYFYGYNVCGHQFPSQGMRVLAQIADQPRTFKVKLKVQGPLGLGAPLYPVVRAHLLMGRSGSQDFDCVNVTARPGYGGVELSFKDLPLPRNSFYQYSAGLLAFELTAAGRELARSGLNDDMPYVYVLWKGS